MKDATSSRPAVSLAPPIFPSVWQWIANHDRNFVALRRAARAAIVTPLLIALCFNVLGNIVVATYAAYGAFALLLLVDFSGSMRQRLEGQLSLILMGGVLLCLGTLVSGNPWLAAAAMTVVGFAVLFSGVVSSELARASTSLLLAFILAVSTRAPVSSLPDSLAGWGLAGLASLAAIAVLWPSPAIDPLRVAASGACKALASRIRAEVAYDRDRGDAALVAAREREIANATSAEGALYKIFISSPYRPTALGTSARTIVRLVDEISWLNAIVDQRARVSQAHAADSTTDALKLAAATVLERGAAQLDCTGGDATTLRESVAALSAAIAKVEEAATSQVVAGADSSASTGSDEQRVDEFIARLDPAFRAQELGFSVSLIARNIDLIASVERRGWWQRMLGRQPTGLAGTFSTAGELASSHVKRHSVWLQNSIRGAVGLGLAVLVADLAGVSRSFWVIFGVLSVLRSSALNTGQSVVRALVGTALGFAASAALLAGMGANANVLWVLLPFVVFLAGVAPAVISFAAGQAAFTLAVVILFNILQPVGWRVGLVRIEDIAIGCGVSLVVGSFFWPRGARAALRHAIAEAYADGAAYLAAAVEFGMGRCDVMRTDFNAPKYAAQRAGASALRLDDAFRNYLAERGAKPYPLADLTPLVTGIAALGLAADAIVDLWKGSDRAARERTVASREIVTVVMAVEGWFDALATCLVAQKELPEPMSRDDAGKARMIDGLRSDLKHTGGATTPTAVRMLWTEEHVDRVRRLQGVIVQRVRAVTERETNTIAPASG